ncbi:hypothetical protein G9P44_003006 [Scheffersomyces stipitis]|nr:hypothetical protein G9P44_003006 [Scheffersomyces stipitis]
MSFRRLKSYSVNAIADLLPLDRATCEEMVDYAITLTSEAETQNHFLNLVGDSTDALAFIGNFLRMKREEEQEQKEQNERVGKQKPPEIPKSSKISSSSSENVWRATGQATKTASPKPKVSNLTGKLNKKTSTTTSQLFGESSTPETSKKSKKRNLDNLKDIESVLNELEIKSDSDDTRRVCNCMATRHPLFEIAPNCLNCGKIICTKEGLQPCSYCGADLLSAKDRVDIMNVLRQEKTEILGVHESDKKPEEVKDVLPKSKSKKIVVTLNAGENLWKAQDRALRQAEAEKKKAQQQLEESKVREKEAAIENIQIERSKINPDLLMAQERLETLLNFQATSAERTKIIDNAADYEISSATSGNMWLSPVERALQLKKQQKQLRRQNDIRSARTGRGERSLEMVIKDGKVTMVEKQRAAKSQEHNEDPDISQLENEIRDSKKKGESAMSSYVWDFESDKTKWEKPVYTSTVEFKGNTSDISRLKPRVQFSQIEGVDLVVSLPN